MVIEDAAGQIGHNFNILYRFSGQTITSHHLF